MPQPDPTAAADLEDAFAAAVDEFTERLNRGERPSVDEYAARYPQLAADLREVLGMLSAIRPPGGPAAGGGPTAPAGPPAGHRPPALAGFAVERELGRGGMGVVYLARQAALNRPVALKMVLSGGHATDQERARFLAEAELIARLQHPGIVQVHEFGADPDGRPFFALEYLPGGSLADRLRDGPLAPAAAAGLVETLARAVGYAHAAGVTHRDLKPANVLFAADGAPKVTDFGLAKQSDSGADLTATGVVLGTPSYMPPEQAAGRPAEVGPAADVYALGAVLYESLTGRPPFRGASVLDTLDLVKNREPIAVRELQPAVPLDLETVCLKCLQKDPRRRYATADALADDLRRFRDGRTIAARPVGAVERGWRWCRRNRLVAGLGATAAGLLVALAVGSTAAAVWYRETLREVERAEGEAVRGRSAAEAAEADAQDKLRRSLRDQARAARASGRMGQRLESLAALAEAARIARERGASADELAALRDEAIAALALPDARFGAAVPTPPPRFQRAGGVMAFDPDYRVAAVPADDGSVRLVAAAGGREVRRLTGVTLGPSAMNGVLRFGPGGQYLVAVEPGWKAAVVSAETGRRLFAVPNVERAFFASFSPDGTRLAVGGLDGVARVVRLPGGEEVWRREYGRGNVAVAFSPDGGRVAVWPMGSPTLHLLAPDTGRAAGQVAVGPARANFALVAWHPSGRFLATTYGEGRGTVAVWDVATGARAAEHQVDHTAAFVSFHPNGELAATLGWDNTTRLWDVWSGKTRLTLPFQVGHPEFSRDGRHLGYVCGTDRTALVEVADAPAYRTLGPAGGAWVGLSPDGRLAAARTPAGVRLWDVGTGRHLGEVGGDGPAAWAADGRLYARPAAGSRLAEWPVAAAGGALRVGPARSLPPDRGGRLTLPPDGRLVYTGGWAYDVTGRAGQPPRLAGGGEYLSVHPAGRLVAYGSWQWSAVNVWDAAAEKSVAQVRVAPQTWPTFSPDGRFLVLAGGPAYTFHDVTTWQPGWELRREATTGPGPLAFTPDGRGVFVELAPRVLSLVGYPGGRVLARFEPPADDRAERADVTPDGGALVAAGRADTGLRVWDLRRVRARLAELGLDWDAPPLPPAPPPDPVTRLEVIAPPAADPVGQFLARVQEATRPGRAEVAPPPRPVEPEPTTAAGWYRRGASRYARGDLAGAIADAGKSLAATPDHAPAAALLVMALSTGPAGLRDPPRALEVARRVLGPRQGTPRYALALGLAHLRAGEHAQAATVLRRLADRPDGYQPATLYALALAYHGTNNRVVARTCRDAAAHLIRAGTPPGVAAASARETDVLADEVAGPLAAPPPKKTAPPAVDKKPNW